MKKAIIVDLDGCLFDTSELINLIPSDAKEWTREQWDEFQKNYSRNFPIIKFVRDTVLAWSKNRSILFITSREARNEVIKDTYDALIRCFGEYMRPHDNLLYSRHIQDYELLMRNDNDYRSSAEVKKDIYTQFIKDRYEIEFAIDDEQQNIEMWRSLGIPCLQVFNV